DDEDVDIDDEDNDKLDLIMKIIGIGIAVIILIVTIFVIVKLVGSTKSHKNENTETVSTTEETVSTANSKDTVTVPKVEGMTKDDAVKALNDVGLGYKQVVQSSTYTIVIPPPNITGRLHMGHALDETLQDILIRYKRMTGFNALWVPGTDHASIATEAKIVAKLKEEGITKEDFR
ncbi:valine--tRNA ligase, partial [human gut metagenome]